MAYLLRTAESFAHALMAKLPVGEVWPRDRDSTLYRFVRGIAGLAARWAQDVWTFLVIEAFPPTSVLLLSDWERVLGLPEPCLPLAGLTVAERQMQVREKLSRRPGRQDRDYFIALGARLGYAITITEYRPFMAGVSRCGDPAWSIAPHAMRFVWRVGVPGPRLTWFRAGHVGGRAGQDPHLTVRRAEDLECVLRALKPAHTNLVFVYSGV